MAEVETYEVGTVFNPLNSKFEAELSKDSVEVLYPARLNAMALDPSKVELNEEKVYTPGEIVFSIDLYSRARVEVIEGDGIEVAENCDRKSLIRHAALIMKDALGFEQGLYIEAQNEHGVKHAGLGSSSGLISAVASAINELYGKPIPRRALLRYLAQNHGEEVDEDEGLIVPVQCIGGSASSGLYNAGLIVLAGESRVVNSRKLSDEWEVVIGVPRDYNSPDAKEALEKEMENMDGFVDTGENRGKEIAYNILHKFLPAMVEEDLETIGDVIFDYRYNMGSNKNCAFMYPSLLDITDEVRPLKDEGEVEVISISSVGPGIFAISKDVEKARQKFEDIGLEVYEANIDNQEYKVVK